MDLHLVLGRLVGSIAHDDISLTPAQAADLDRRIDEHHAGKAELIPGDVVFERLRHRYRPTGEEGVAMQTVMGTTPAGTRDRQLDLWVDEQGLIHFWIHAPGGGNDQGWEIRVARDALLTALSSEGVRAE
jgi:putative addiction module component (TIGR02574 family)